MEQIVGQLRQYVVENFLFGQDANRLGNGDSFLETGILDSTGMLEVVSFLEETWGIKVEDEELVPENLDSIDNLAEYVRRKLQGDRATAS